MIQFLGVVITTLHFFLTYKWAQKARMFVLDKPFKPSEM
jgi:hypothetical protein